MWDVNKCLFCVIVMLLTGNTAAEKRKLKIKMSDTNFSKGKRYLPKLCADRRTIHTIRPPFVRISVRSILFVSSGQKITNILPHIKII